MKKAFFSLERRLGRYIFDNMSGLTGNIGGKLNLLICRFLSDKDRTITDEGKGVIKLDHKVSDELVDEIESEFQTVVDSGEALEYEVEGKVVKEYYPNMQEGFRQRFSGMESVVNQLKDEIEAYYGSHFKPKYLDIIRYREQEESDFNTRSCHLDKYSPDHIRVFVLLTDTPEEGGKSCFISRKDAREALKSVDRNFMRDDDFWDQWDKTSFYGEKGSTAIANPTQNFHRGGNPVGHRDMILITLKPSPYELEESWLEEADLVSGEGELNGFSSFVDTVSDLIK